MQRELPHEFCNLMKDLLQNDYESFEKAMSEEPVVAVRLNPRKSVSGVSDEGLYDKEERVGWNISGRYLPERPLFTLDPLLHAGAYYVQDASSMVHGQAVAAISSIEQGRKLTLLDLCAAPGGKTTAMIDSLPDGSVAVANEFVGKRCKILRENLSKWGYPHIVVTNTDTSAFRQIPEEFDIVAVDAPCSGEGMMRKDEDALSQWTPGLVESCSMLQREILRNAITALKPGGWLLYSTCTYNVKENESNSLWLRDECGLQPVDLPLEGLPEGCHALSSRLGIAEAIRFMPHIARGEGLFFCAFRKPDSWKMDNEEEITQPSSTAGSKRDKKKKYAGKEANKKKTDTGIPAGWVSPGITIEEECGRLRAITPETEPIARRIREAGIHLKAGIEIAEMKGRDWQPSAELALSGILRPDAFPDFEADEPTALSYLRHEALMLPPATPRGMITISYKGLRLGFLKNIGSRANNLYPSEWRIRMQ